MEKFGSEYYRAFYPAQTIDTRKATAVEVFRMTRAMSRLAFQADLRSVADVGAGMGLWKEAIVEDNPELFRRTTRNPRPIPFDSFDASKFSASKHGSTLMNIVSQEPKDVGGRIKYDLVICNGVFGYLADDELEVAVANLENYAGRFLYVGELYCKEDIEAGKYDMKGTDTGQKVRSIREYGEILRTSFLFAGMGLWVNSNHAGVFMASEIEIGF